MCLAQGHNTVTPVRLEPAAPQSRVKHSTTESLRSPESAHVLKEKTYQYELYDAVVNGTVALMLIHNKDKGNNSSVNELILMKIIGYQLSMVLIIYTKNSSNLTTRFQKDKNTDRWLGWNYRPLTLCGDKNAEFNGEQEKRIHYLCEDGIEKCFLYTG